MGLLHRGRPQKTEQNSCQILFFLIPDRFWILLISQFRPKYLFFLHKKVKMLIFKVNMSVK